MNELIIIGEIISVFSILLICKRLFGKNGLIAWVGLATVLANIITAKNVNILGLSTAIGTVMFASTFLATDILTECYSVKDAKKAVRLGLFSNVILIVSTQIALFYTPSEFDYANDAMKTLFSLNLRISIASAVMYYIANMADINVFSKIREKTGNGKLWLRNNVATILCNCLENFGFIGLAFAGIYDFSTIMTIALSTSVIEAIVAVCDTPFLYIAKKLKNGDETALQNQVTYESR